MTTSDPTASERVNEHAWRTGAGSSTGPDHHTYTFERIQELPLGR
ncbi:hypothetical protein [Streptomyces canus]